MKRVGSILMITLLMITFMIPYLRDPVIVSGTDNLPSGYTPVTDDQELAQAFNAYCKSRDCSFTGTNEGAVYTYLYNDIKKGLGYLGYNIDELQEGLFAQYNSAGEVSRFYWNSTSIGIANQLFAYFIRENDLEVGDSADLELYNGRWFVDADGNGCLISIYLSTTFGTPYKYTSDEIINAQNINLTWHTTDTQTLTQNVTYNEKTGTVSGSSYTETAIGYNGYVTGTMYKHTFVRSGYNNDGYGYPSVVVDNNNLYLGIVFTQTINGNTSTSVYYDSNYRILNKPATDIPTATVNFVANNIKNEYQGDTYITNEGDIVTNEGDHIYNPYPDGGGSNTPPTNTGGGSGADDTEVTFPNFDFQFPEIDWSLGDLSEKFPFSIPFDLVAFFTVMNAEPQAPQIDREIPLGSWYTWRFQADFSQFDDYAVIIRNVEFIAFCIGLIYLTIRLTKG